MPPLPHMRRPNSPVMFGRTPNISGEVWWASGTTSKSAWSKGAFSVQQSGTSFAKMGDPGNGDLKVNFSASSSSSIFSGNSVQPNALYALACIRV